jgi:hypothetical protein
MEISSILIDGINHTKKRDVARELSDIKSKYAGSNHGLSLGSIQSGIICGLCMDNQLFGMDSD